jgi:glutathione S-transferase
MSSKLVLYDLPRKTLGNQPITCWSPNVWKTRLVLNYKKIPYETKWLKHAEITPTLTGNITPAPARYTLPAVKLTDSSYVMDSALIAPVLEEQVPEPSLHLENDLHNKVGPLIGRSLGPIMPIVYAQIGRNIIPESYQEEWIKGKEAQFGCTMTEFEERAGGEKAWGAAEQGLKALGEFMKANKQDDGPFILGSQVCYADFILAALVESTIKIGGGLHERIVATEPQLKDLHEACRPWLENDQ